MGEVVSLYVKPSNVAEAECFDRLIEAGWIRIMWRGWPDFLVSDDKGRTFAVEVKSGHDPVRHEQEVMMELLGEAGIPCFVYTPRNGFKSFAGRPEVSPQFAHVPA